VVWSNVFFRENNAPGRVAEDTIDLHGQFDQGSPKSRPWVT
jgi:hypothetical protein